MKHKTKIIESAQSVEDAHQKAVKARREEKQKRCLFMVAQLKRQEAELELTRAKEAIELQIIEKI